ncbi:cobalt-precorrin-5B (C(1))-methyltransferase CbiD [Bacteroides sp.]|jgi:cobalt-precorrin-5B (C1)-methyltransferase|uniref:cobalt-precorrin-5B (C(1))-methyltransferase CbiD n=1 Tax=Bacteroides sp. TaxID=29523 RepID=UPI0025B9AED7|nr:cobalt-precorrin-5B (C(1))-methyltransferase CbiD [Bacteroides sp.]
MILILGGTTEGRIAARTLEEAGKTFYYSTKGDEQEVTMHHGIRLQGAMDELDLERCCREHNIQLLVDAAHPFAIQLHQTVEKVAHTLNLLVIRFERIYPPRDEEHIIWCEDFEDAIRQIRKEDIFTLLALTGVQSIAKLKPLWQESACCYFRILNRESSRRLAEREGFPEKYLHYYHAGEDERILLQRLHPEAILIKESGLSGGFNEKVEAALQEGIRIFAIRRPPMPGSFMIVNGEHGLRRMIEKHLPDFYPLRSGLTTGTCAAAAAVAATWDIFNVQRQSRPEEFPVILPNGETIYVPVEEQERYPHPSCVNDDWMLEADATVIKDAGDDPDVTNGMQIKANVALPFRFDDPTPAELGADDYTVIVCGGEGVGIVTLSGLGLEVGGPAINVTPRKMIENNVKACLQRLGISKHPNPFAVTISVPGGEEIARRTFNPRLGIEGGISIIGTSGIVKPFSSEAFVDSIRKSMEVGRATGSPRIVLNSGAKSEKYVRGYYPELPAQAFIHYGNFIGDTIKIAADLEIKAVTLGIMIGKAVKLAEGNLDTHSKQVTMNKDFLLDLAFNAGCGDEVPAIIKKITLARELWTLLPADDLQAFCTHLLELCHQHCDPLLPDGELTILLISEEGKII